MINEELSQQYIIGQATCDIKVGDSVLLTRAVESRSDGWGANWTSTMDRVVGKVGEVVGTGFPPTSGFRVRFPGLETVNVYPYFALRRINERDARLTLFGRRAIVHERGCYLSGNSSEIATIEEVGAVLSAMMALHNRVKETEDG